MTTDLTSKDDLRDFCAEQIAIEDETKTVWVSGNGPAVILMPEMPGISPHVLRFARWVRDSGFTVFVPSLFGVDGAVPSATEGAQVFQRACVSREFHAMAGHGASPVTNWLRGLARLAHARCGGPGVGAIGMCFTGNFALSMMLEPAVLAPVLSQPTLPLDDPGGIESSDEEAARVRSRLEAEDLTILGFRFEGDRFCQAQRFRRYEELLGTRFDGRTLPDKAANRHNLPPFFEAHVPSAHSVLTVHLVDETDSLTLQAREEVLNHLRLRLLSESE